MAIKIAVCNQKGGIGKTTTSLCLADAFTHIGYSVLFLDFDAQCNSTSTYGAEIEGVKTIVDVLKKDCKAEEAIQHTPLGDIIAGDPLLSQEESHFNAEMSRETIAKRTLKSLEDKYDIIIIDTPPNLGLYMINALSYADGCIIPIHADRYAIMGLNALLNSIMDIVEYVNPDLTIYGVFQTLFESRNKLDNDVAAELPGVAEQSNFRVFKTKVRKDQAIPKLQNMSDYIDEDGERVVVKRSLYELFKSSNAAKDYADLAKELLDVISNQ